MTTENEVITTLATYFVADQPFRLAIKARWPGEPRELFELEEWARVARDADRAKQHCRRAMQLADDRDEVEVAHERGVLIGIEHARQIAKANGRAQRVDGHRREPDDIAGQLEHEIERVVGTEPQDRDRIHWLRTTRPFTLRDEVELARALRAAATERGRIGGVVLSKEAALGVADLLDENAKLRARNAVARKMFDQEVLGR